MAEKNSKTYLLEELWRSILDGSPVMPDNPGEESENYYLVKIIETLQQYGGMSHAPTVGSSEIDSGLASDGQVLTADGAGASAFENIPDPDYTALNAMTTPLGTDILPIVDDPGGTPENQKITVSNLLTGGVDLIPSARVYNNANIVVGTGADTLLTFNSQRWNTDDMHNTGVNPGRLTCKTAGIYHIHGQASFETSPTGVRQYWFVVSGTTEIARDVWGPDGNILRHSLSTVWELAVDDYVEFYVWQNSGGDQDVEYVTARSPEFMMTRIG
jgi:hypothetical protein